MLDFARYVAGLLLVLGLLAGFAYILRRGAAQGLIPGLAQGGRGERRLQLVESLMIDPRRRVVIVRADETEHVLLLGATNEIALDTRPAKPEEPAFEPELPAEAGGEPQ